RKSIEGYRDHLVELAEQMLADWQPGQVRNIFRDMTHYMLRVTSSILFGFDLPELAYEIGHMIERWVAMNHELGMGALISDPGISSAYSKRLELAEALEAKMLAMINLCRSLNSTGNDVLSLLILARAENGARLPA